MARAEVFALAPAIETRDICKEFVTRSGFWGFLRPRSRTVLERVTVAFPAGAVCGLSGPNGAGKTTFLKILSGILLPTSGSVLLSGAEVSAQGASWRKSVAITIAESRSFYWRLTCRQNLEFFAALLGLDAGQRTPRIDAVASRIGVADFLDERFSTLSSGQMQRMALARALLSDPDVWLLDEPERDLDKTGVDALRNEIESMRRSGRCVVLVSHDDDALQALCDPVVRLEHGRIQRPGA
jgi:ABC-2 type transport system ATP-binding protein